MIFIGIPLKLEVTRLINSILGILAKVEFAIAIVCPCYFNFLFGLTHDEKKKIYIYLKLRM